jgi:YggT family protein
MSALAAFAAIIPIVRLTLLYGGIAIAVICAIDWAVRTRRINPFSKVARFFRGSIDPMMAPIERVIVRAGGVPSAAAWWTLVAYVVFGILLISLLGFVYGILYQIVAMAYQPSEAWRVLLSWAFDIMRLALLVRVLSSWLPISPHSKWLRWSYVLTEWMLAPMRRVIPMVGMFDISPIVAWILLSLVERVILA